MELTGDPLIIGLQIAVIGIMVVFLALVLVSLALSLLNYIDARLKRRAIRQPAPQSAAPAPAEPAGASAERSPELSPELVAVVAAAANEILGYPVRVTRIRYHRQAPGGGWSQQGRLTVMAGHRPRSQG
jgi:Na+-transporting methylmalonyl-CoA/oxaloacetate decarboxylase gamma subunit